MLEHKQIAGMHQMQEVELTRQANAAMDTYRELYLARYNKKPILQSHTFAAAMTIFKDVIREVGLEHAVALITQYFRMNGDNDWYKRQGHSISTFSKNLDSINAALPVAAKKEKPELSIIVDSQCPTCEKYFQLQTTTKLVAKSVYMTACPECSKRREAAKF